MTKAHAFRMPLYGPHGRAFMTAGFDQPVFCPLNGLKIRCKTVDALVMGAVDRETLSVKLCRKGTGKGSRRMGDVTRFCGHVLLRTRQMLCKAAAEKHIKDLMTPADAKDGLSRPQISRDEAQFRLIAGGIHAKTGGVFFN